MDDERKQGDAHCHDDCDDAQKPGDAGVGAGAERGQAVMGCRDDGGEGMRNGVEQ